MEEESADTMMEERMELMVPPTGGKPTLRTAYFLKPTHLEENLSSFSLLSSNLIIPKSKKNPLNVLYPGWRRPQKGWKAWVDQLRPLHEDIWKKSGILDAILASTYQTLRDNDLIMNLAEKWCLDTNTFFFPWGEATITLEDMMVLGGYSVLGNSTVSPPVTEDMVCLKQKLSNTHEAVSHSSGQYTRDYAWMKHFKGSGENLEHEAFLVLWLSRYVFSMHYDVVRKDVFNIAITLSRGVPIALAPAVLASIYRDMGLLKKSLIALTETEDGKCGSDELSKLTLSAPLHLVQLWAWERFPALRPKPNHIEFGEPRIARWHKLAEQNDEDVRKALDSAGEDFQWRPYTIKVENWNFEKFYKENQECVLVDSGMDFEVESWIRCLRVSELVGSNGIEQYLPHRVAMQFGFDQDVPGFVKRPNNLTPVIAWSNYNRPIRDARLYRPARLFESDVTKRYLKWWDKLTIGQENATYRNVVLPGFTSHIHEVQQQVDEDEITAADLMNRKKWAQRNDEVEVRGSLKVRSLAEILMCAEKSAAIKRTQSVTSSVRSEDENLERVLKKSTTSTSVKGKESLASIDKNQEESHKHGVGEQIESKTETADDGSVAGVESTTEIAEISEQNTPELPERQNRKDEMEKLEARISYLERIVAEMKNAMMAKGSDDNI